MRALSPVTRLIWITAALTVLMLSRSLAAASVGLVCGLICLWLSSGFKPALKGLSGSLLLCVLVSVTDPLVSHRGMTILLFVNDRPYTLESMLYGLELGLSLSGAAVWLSLSRRLISDREMLYIFGRISPKLAMTVSMTLGFIPRLREKNRRIHEAQLCSGLGAGSSPSQRITDITAVFGACLAWSAEAAAGAAQSMNARGYGSGKMTFSEKRRFGKADMILTVMQILLTSAALVMSAKGGATDFFPTLRQGRYEMHMAAIYALACLPVTTTLAKEKLQWTLFAAKG